MKKNIVVLLVIALLVGIIPETNISAKASYVKLVKKSAVLSVTEEDTGIVYETTQIRIKTMYGAKILKTSYISKNKKIAAVSAKGKVKARKQGSTHITVNVRYKRLGRQFIKKLSFSVKVVETQDSDSPSSSDSAEQLEEELEESEEKPVEGSNLALPAQNIYFTEPTIKSTDEPTVKPTVELTAESTKKPTAKPTEKPTVEPTIKLTEKPTVEQTTKPAEKPTVKPTVEPAIKPTVEPAIKPTVKSTVEPTAKPTEKPTIKPTTRPTVKPTAKPTIKPTTKPTVKPTAKPTVKPTIKPTQKPTTTPVPYKTLPNGMYKFNTKVHSSMMLDVSGDSTKDGTNIQIYQGNESNAQRFNITQLESGWYKICNVSSGKALDVTGGVKKSGVNVQLYTYNGSDAQLWRFYPAENGYVYIQNKLGYYLDVDGAGTANNTNVSVYTKNETNAQKWKPIQIIFPTSISLDSSAVTLTKIGETKKLTAVFAPANVTQKGLTWDSSDKNVVTVSDGTVKAVGSGTATITVKTVNGKTASKKITVNDGCASVSKGYYCFNTKLGSNFMLDVSGHGTSDGSNIQIYQKNGSAAQKFYVEHAGNGWYIISNTVPKKCLDVEGGSNKSGTNVQLYQSNGSDAQKWRFYSTGDGYYTIMNKYGCYLDVKDGSAKNDSNVQAYAYNGTNAQKWKLISTKEEYTNIANSLYCIKAQVGNNMTLDVSGSGASDGTNIQIYQSNNSIAQKFTIQSTGDGWYKISNPFSGKCLDVQGGSPKSGTNVQLYSYNGSDAQKWRFYREGDCYVIKNKLGCYLDVDGAKDKNGTNVLVYTKNGTNAQKWKIAETSAIVLSPSSFALDGVGKTRNISVSYEPAYVFAANKTIQWSSSNAKVATVSNGTVKAVGAGTATITAKAFNGQTCVVTVTVKTDNAQISLNVPSYKQTDLRWKDVYIGTKTIGSVGCLLTSLSMKYSYHTGTATYPNNMKSKLQFSNNDLYWSSVSALGYTYTNKYGTRITNDIMKLIYNKLKEGKPVVIGGMKSDGSAHWIIIKGYRGTNTLNFSSSNFLINDPSSSVRVTLDQFLSTYTTVLRLIW